MGEFYRPSLPIRGSINNIVRLANSGSLEALNEKTLRGLSREVYPRNIDSKKRVAEVKVLAPSRKNAKGAAHSRKTLKKSDQYALDLHMTREKVASLNISAGNRLVSLHRWDDPSPSKTYEIEAKFVKDFIHNKKEVNGIIAFDPKLFGVKHDRVPLKYFHYNHAVDPVYGSFIFNKLINAFSKNGKKRKIRKLFYDIIEENRPDLSAGAFIHIIQSLKPAFINVKVRHGKLHSKAPIPASDVKATIKAIKFFKAAVYAHRHLDTLKEKIETEALDYLY